MGKKKDERKRREREVEIDMRAGGHHAGEPDGGGHKRHKHDDGKHDSGKQGGGKHAGGAPFAGIAATIARQMGTPVGRQMIAAGLMAAATAISKHDAKANARPTPPTPPSPPSPAAPSQQAEPGASKVEPDVAAETAKPQGNGPFAGDTPEPPRSEKTALPPEFAKVLDSVTVGLERLFVGFGKPTGKKDPPAA
ncbi:MULTISPECIES: hypothetical protein [unclassified Sphingomonas]|uniref:hypothetical protein n=1 Tax=unclassified Sphingomonas TaxID=196159 RepID=UPI0006F9C506|nr:MULTISPECIES: hypothetical protein [unclassified Sphingomonas]KQS50751.1 hypothetical protein ASG20_01070 [Sphingomonas sp. Leaf198]